MSKECRALVPPANRASLCRAKAPMILERSSYLCDFLRLANEDAAKRQRETGI